MLPGKPVSDEIDEIDEIDEACALVRLRALRPQGATVRPQRGSALFSGGVPKPRQFLKSVLSCSGKYDIGSTIKYSILESMTDSKKLVLNSTKCMLTK
jgi:hypothetical protein